MGTWRFYVWWPAREVVRLETWQADELGTDRAVVWFLERGQTVRNGAENAAACMRCALERNPRRVLMQDLPRGAEETIHLVDEPGVELMLEQCAWVPKGYLVAV